MIEQILTDFRPARVLCVGNRAQEFIASLREHGVSAHRAQLDEQSDDTTASRFDLCICVGMLAAVDAEAAERTVGLLCRRSDTVLFSALAEAAELPESDQNPQSFWVTQFAHQSFYRDVDYDASFLAPSALCLRRLTGSNIPVLASYERHLVQLERERATYRLVSQEYRDMLQQRDLEVEALRMELAQMAVALRIAPAGTTRERYFHTAMGGVRRASQAALRGLDLGGRLVRRSKALLRSPSRV